MANDYKYKLQEGSKKSRCPVCNHKTFVQYIDTTTGDLLPDQYGRCDRESKCAYHVLPPSRPQETKCLFVPFSKLINYSEKAFQITTSNGICYLPKSMVFEKLETGFYVSEWYLKNTKKPPEFLDNDFRFYLKSELIDKSNNLKKENPIQKRETEFIPVEVFNQTRQGYEQNVFIQNLLCRIPFPFEVKAIEQVISQYNLGTICKGYRTGAITFPFIDIAGNVRTIQVKQFDQSNHSIGTDFLHSIIEKHHAKRNEPLPGWLEAYKCNEKKVSCLFGEHLLNKYPLNPVALVEAPKTAVYCSLYFGFPASPEELLWLAVYNLSSLNIEKCKVLQGKDVYLFPDLSKEGKAYELWCSKAEEFSSLMPSTQFEVSDLIEKLAPKELKEQGADIADVLIKLDWRKFRNTEIAQKQSQLKPRAAATPKCEKGENSEAPKQTYFLQPEIQTPTPTTTLSMEQLKAMAIQHFNRTMIKDKATARDKYLRAWANDMGAMIQAAGGKQEQFLNSIL